MANPVGDKRPRRFLAGSIKNRGPLSSGLAWPGSSARAAARFLRWRHR